MSGICGIVDHEVPADPAVLRRLVEAAGHRALAGVGTWVQQGVGLAYLAAAVTPESVGERQPVAGEQGEVLVADARLDNREELLARLPDSVGSGSTDAELILAAYRRWGTGCAGHLLGDFAFALWDGRERRLFAARDPMGMRSLYYRAEPRRTLFATEIKQIQAAPGVPARVDEAMVAAHLAGVPGPPGRTFHQGVSSLSPGHGLLVDAGGARTWRFWDVDSDRRIVCDDPREYAEAFRDLFVEAVRCRLRSVSPVAILLSGGVDSGCVASSAGWLLRRGGVEPPPVRAYCWSFSELAGCDERQVSAAIASHYDLPVSEVPADEAWPLQGYPAHGPDRDDPLLGPFQVIWEQTLSRARDEGVGLVLTGVRGDLIVGGPVFDDLGLLLALRLADLGRDLRQQRREAGRSWPRILGERLVRPAAAGLWPPHQAPRLRHRVAGGRPDPPLWMHPDFARRAGLAELLNHRPLGGSRFRSQARRQRYELVQSDEAMRDVIWLERMLARSGLAYADPWSDRRLVEFVLAVPQWSIQRHGEPKLLARQAMRGIMPETARRRVGKVVPKAFFTSALRVRARETVVDLLTATRAGERGYLLEPALREHYVGFLGGEHLAGAFWRALTLEIWLRQHGDVIV